MAAQAKVGVIINKHFLVDRTMRVVADRAAFAHRFMLENKRARLGHVALRATLILPRHGQAALRFEDVTAVRVVAIHAIHVAFDDRMMLRQVKFRLYVQMTLKTGLRFFTGVDDEAGLAAGMDMLAARAVAGLATALAGHRRIFNMQARVRASREFSDNIRMAIGAGPVADVMRSGNF